MFAINNFSDLAKQEEKKYRVGIEKFYLFRKDISEYKHIHEMLCAALGNEPWNSSKEFSMQT